MIVRGVVDEGWVGGAGSQNCQSRPRRTMPSLTSRVGEKRSASAMMGASASKARILLNEAAGGFEHAALRSGG